MPLTSASTLTTKVETTTTQTIYPAYYIRSAAEPTAYLHHTYSTENYSNDVNLGTIDYAKAWKLDKDNNSADLSIVSAARGSTLSHHLNDTLILNPDSTRKWKVEQAGIGSFRISGNSPEISGKYWTLDSKRETVSLEVPVKGNAPLQDQLKQQWVFEAALFV